MVPSRKFFHGTLEAIIFHGTSYTPTCPFNWLFPGERPAYVTINLGKTKVAETRHQLDRTWNESFHILCAHPWGTTITITLRSNNSILGRIHIQAASLLHQPPPLDNAHCLFSEKGKPIPKLKLRFQLYFRPVELHPHWGRGLVSQDYKGLTRGVTFPERTNCAVVLYQDAHHENSFKPPIDVSGGGKVMESYRPRKLWEDVYRAIDGAKHFIYIAGWSLNPKMVLVRDFNTELQQARGVSIGELLKRKAEEGIVVRIMLWDDETSLPLINNNGLMRTHDELAFNYFKQSRVICKLCPRLHNKLPTVFAHHQKTVTLDSNVNQGRREIVSFIGGLDLCDGRYDTEQHSLFRTLNTDEIHANDFYQINLAGATLNKGGPREPWHDVHARVTGQAAWDILLNFNQRWSRHLDPSLLLQIETIQDLQNYRYQDHVDDHSWNVQVLRSIDNSSALDLPANLRVEQSIHEAYVDAIRRADKFICIENQYFIGGCHMWEKDVDSGCRNLIPIEIAFKVAQKIRDGERFAVYIVIPMWPEGVPESEPVQDMLHWTRMTMRMMYKIVGEAIKETGRDHHSHPRDYLNFFCLANREEMKGDEFLPPSSPQHGSHYWEAQKHRRFMVYVHSKLMIVDDEHVIIGSANINQRSMDGERDTEIAIACYQPNFTNEKRANKQLLGDVHAYRMSLWYEHIGRIETPIFMEPQSLDCVKKLCEIGDEMWRVYSGSSVMDMEGVHLVSYPVSVTNDGLVGDLQQGGGTFPDTNTLIRGKRSKLIPSLFTT